MTRTLVTGATGLIGRALLSKLSDVVVLSRDPRRARAALGSVTAFAYDGLEPPSSVAFDGVEAVVHLAGESIDGRWSEEKKRRIYDSRVLGTRNLVAALRSLPRPPAVLVCASGVGYYGDRGEEVLTESSVAGSDWLASVCVDWEKEALAAAEFGVRVVNARIAPVLAREAGLLAKILPIFRAGLGGRLGGGQQWMPWVHLRDAADLLALGLQSQQVSGPMNVVAARATRNTEFTKALGSVLGRPTLLPVPRVALRLALGEMHEAALASQRVEPAVALSQSFRFSFPSIEEALSDLVGER